jgi:addiction module HigA family antidote
MARMHNPAHPGEVLRDYLPEGLAVTEAARRLGVTRQTLSALLNGRAGVSADMALRLEAGCRLRSTCGRRGSDLDLRSHPWRLDGAHYDESHQTACA